MRAKEFVNEAKEIHLSKVVDKAAIHARQYKDMDQYYDMYRLGVAMAGAPDQGTPKAGPVKDNPTVWMYTDAEVDIVNRAEKEMGVKGTSIVAPGGSEELDSANTHSPVATRKRNKYGV
jgi:hypothetical protein